MQFAGYGLSLIHILDGASFPVAAKDMANLRGREIGVPYTPNLPTPEGPVLDKIKAEMTKAGLISVSYTHLAGLGITGI